MSPPHLSVPSSIHPFRTLSSCSSSVPSPVLLSCSPAFLCSALPCPALPCRVLGLHHCLLPCPSLPIPSIPLPALSCPATAPLEVPTEYLHLLKACWVHPSPIYPPLLRYYHCHHHHHNREAGAERTYLSLFIRRPPRERERKREIGKERRRSGWVRAGPGSGPGPWNLDRRPFGSRWMRLPPPAIAGDKIHIVVYFPPPAAPLPVEPDPCFLPGVSLIVAPSTAEDRCRPSLNSFPADARKSLGCTGRIW